VYQGYDASPQDWEPEVTVCRSRLDPTVWYCVAGTVGDISSLECPGRLRAVKRYAEENCSFDEEVRWVRRDRDTWVMEFVDA